MEGIFRNKGWIVLSTAWNNTCVICSLTKFSALIWFMKFLIHSVARVFCDWLKELKNNVVIRGNNKPGVKQ